MAGKPIGGFHPGIRGKKDGNKDSEDPYVNYIKMGNLKDHGEKLIVPKTIQENLKK